MNLKKTSLNVLQNLAFVGAMFSRYLDPIITETNTVGRNWAKTVLFSVGSTSIFKHYYRDFSYVLYCIKYLPAYKSNGNNNANFCPKLLNLYASIYGTLLYSPRIVRAFRLGEVG